MCKASGFCLDVLRTALAALRTSSWSSIVEARRREVRVAVGFAIVEDWREGTKLCRGPLV